ncbi:hypothetical protein [uncultured Nitratireductor sp.]|uniref:hypothetical protein n=1 Tax=uncultured Nitratireductor sp. TaxID=520953 RepID=UPI0025FF541E|nr:hypothetical protein [uncultured Nitratireductor sp.]
MVNYRLFVSSILLSAAAVMSGCQSDNATDGMNLQGGNARQPAVQSADQAVDAVRESELRAYCPPVSLREGTAYFTTYQKGGQDQADKVIYQASISDVTRKCTYSTGSFGMTVAVAGRVVPGPVGTTGTITMPIRIAAIRGGEVVYSKLFQHQVAISDTAGATQFIFNDPNITISGAPDRSIQVMVGYDEGPNGGR